MAAFRYARVETRRRSNNVNLASLLGLTARGECADRGFSASFFVKDTAALGRVENIFGDSSNAASIIGRVTVSSTVVKSLRTLDDGRSSYQVKAIVVIWVVADCSYQ